ncbi:MAG: hypothetical protein OXC18_12895 [Desulfurellaceae bacterium]|nr:hypothetical protein [Desulfurellaceae bacterium]
MAMSDGYRVVLLTDCGSVSMACYASRRRAFARYAGVGQNKDVGAVDYQADGV